ncbi:hypothetical protein [Bacillus wiedmannii]|uniref:hypothetical protein n=1 Tax=Bacillus wiedmannii TaxID=1890302 RepID=UPI002E2107B3|nr:hypothetical protein [Bacillus wiedmannii]
MNEEDYKLSSDVGKLRLSAKDIYDYNAQEKKYNNSDPIINKQKLQDNFNANLIASDDIHSVTGFGAYALEDRNTHEIFIVYVGTQPSQIGDLATDGAIWLHNLTNSPILGSLAEFQYSQAEKIYEKVKAGNKGKKITLLGHSESEFKNIINNKLKIQYDEFDGATIVLHLDAPKNPKQILQMRIDIDFKEKNEDGKLVENMFQIITYFNRKQDNNQDARHEYLKYKAQYNKRDG